ncbi:hypothetical protein P3S67_028848 [Capsicum chacoense]
MEPLLFCENFSNRAARCPKAPARHGDRRRAEPQGSFVCSLNSKDLSKMLKHIYRLWICMTY